MSNQVRSMFSRIAQRYDLVNDVLSLGTHRGWRRRLLDYVGLNSSDAVLDLCCGTGDLTFEAARRLKCPGKVTGIDFSPAMLEVAQKKLSKVNRTTSRKTSFMLGDAMDLSALGDAKYDLITIGFGIRNVDDPVACLASLKQHLTEEGKIGILEFGQPRIPGFATVYRLYGKFLIPIIGGIISGDMQAYRYLPSTASRFPCKKSFVELMNRAGYADAGYKSLSGGIAYVYRAKANS